MAEENVPLKSDQNVEYYLVTMFEKLEVIRQEATTAVDKTKISVQVEIRTLEFWKSVISECLASFIYVFVVCGAAAGAGAGVGAPISSVLATALASGFVMTSLTQCFGHISGAHVNPSVSIAMGVIKRISLLRTLFFILAQCGGGIAGAAFLYGVTVVPGYQGNLSAVIGHSANIAPWERFGVEFMLTFIVVFSYFVSMDTYRKWTGTSSLTIGSTYAACSFVYMPYLNPARSLGPSFVLNRWENHWVYWLGPFMGGIASSLVYEYIFNHKRQRKVKESQNDESSSMNSDEIDNYGELDKPEPPKFESTYSNYRSNLNGGPNYCASLYSAPPTKLERGESLYGGTKSLYCNSPPLTRANLNRSQSVYAKSNTGINKDILPRPGPLVPTQSMYPLRLNHQSHVQNQNVQNQLQQRSESSYGIRGITPGLANRTEGHGTAERQRDNYSTAERQRDNYSTTERQRSDNYSTTERRRDNYAPIESSYGTRNNPSHSESTTKFEEGTKPNRGRPESMYGMLGAQARRVQSAQSDDSNYSSYTVNSSSRNGSGSTNNAPYHNSQNSGNYPPKTNYAGPPSTRSVSGSESRPTQPPSSTSYHHQHSPNPQY